MTRYTAIGLALVVLGVIVAGALVVYVKDSTEVSFTESYAGGSIFGWPTPGGRNCVVMKCKSKNCAGFPKGSYLYFDHTLPVFNSQQSINLTLGFDLLQNRGFKLTGDNVFCGGTADQCGASPRFSGNKKEAALLNNWVSSFLCTKALGQPNATPTPQPSSTPTPYPQQDFRVRIFNFDPANSTFLPPVDWGLWDQGIPSGFGDPNDWFLVYFDRNRNRQPDRTEPKTRVETEADLSCREWGVTTDPNTGVETVYCLRR